MNLDPSLTFMDFAIIFWLMTVAGLLTKEAVKTAVEELLRKHKD